MPDDRPPTDTAATPTPAPPLASPGQRPGVLLVLILGTLTALTALSMDLYLPALPDITDGFHSTSSRVQLTLTACLVGLALGQVLVGPLSDALGRRRPLLCGLAAFAVATFACAAAPTVETLVVFRVVQGLAGAAGVVIARAVVRDLYSGLDVARFLSSLMLVAGAAPILAPLVGGQVLRFTNWRGTFVVLGVVGVALTAVVAARLPETLTAERRHTGGFRQTRAAMGGLLADTRFLGYVLTGAFGFAALFAYVSGSTFVVQEVYGASPQTFSLFFGLNALGMVAAGQLNGRVLVGRVPLDRVLATGLALLGVASAALVVLVSGVVVEVGLAPVAACLFVLASASGITLPNVTAQGLILAPHAAGSAAALLGTAPFLVGALAPPLVGLGGEDTALPMALVMLGSTALASVAFAGLTRPWRRPAEVPA